MIRRAALCCVLGMAPSAIAQKGDYAGPAESMAEFGAPVVDDPADHAVSPARLDALRVEVEETGGDVLLVMRDGKVVYEWRATDDRAPIECMSATKSIVALGVGALLHQGLLGSIDTPVIDVIPEFKGGEGVTVRMLMNHTSGLSGAFDTGAIYQADDVYEFAIESANERPVGESFAYNNNAANLLMAVIGERAERPADEFIAESIFEPLGITAWSWYRDPAGHPHGMAGCKLQAHDLAKIGLLMLDDGVHDGRRLVPDGFVEACTTPSSDLYPRVGLLWWLLEDEAWIRVISREGIDALAAHAAIEPEVIAGLEPLAGRTGTDESLAALIEEHLGKEAGGKVLDESRRLGLFVIRRVPGPTAGYYADGYLGQFLVVLPKERLIVVRQQQRRDHPRPLDPNAFTSLARSLPSQ